MKLLKTRENFWVDLGLAVVTTGLFIKFLTLDQPVVAVLLLVGGLTAMLTHGTYWVYRGWRCPPR